MKRFQIISVLVVAILTSNTAFAQVGEKFIWQCKKEKEGKQIAYRVVLERFGGYSLRKYTDSVMETLITRTICDFDEKSGVFFCYRGEPSLGGMSTYDFVPKAPIGSANSFTLYDRTTAPFNLHYIINEKLDDDLQCEVFISD